MMDDVGIFIIEIDPIYSHDTPSPAPPPTSTLKCEELVYSCFDVACECASGIGGSATLTAGWWDVNMLVG